MAKMQMSLKARALRYLSMREHSRIELQRKLAMHAQEGDDVDALLGWLEANNFLSQERFAESLVRRRAGRFGNSRILMELASHGIAGEVLADLKGELTDEDSRATEALARKFSSPPQDAPTRAKYIRFLQQRGFSSRAVKAALVSLAQDQDA